MADINTRKLGDKWEYYFETAKMDGKRKRFNKVGFSTKKEALKAGSEAYHIMNTIISGKSLFLQRFPLQII